MKIKIIDENGNEVIETLEMFDICSRCKENLYLSRTKGTVHKSGEKYCKNGNYR